MTAIVPALAGRTDRGVRWPLLVLVALVGVASGLVAAGFVAALRALTDVLGPEQWSDTAHLFVLGGVGAAIALITLLLGNPGDVELLVDNIHVSGGRSDIRDLRSLIPVSLLGIAAGSAIGPEAPLVQTTGSIGSWVGLRLRLSEDELRLLTISGMAAGFTVLLGVPLGSAVFALEILHRRGLEYYEALLPALVGALSGYGVYVAITGLGLDPALHLPAPASIELGDLALAVGLGVAGAVVAATFTYGTQVLRSLWRRVPAAARPIVGGFALGGLAFASPYALTFGEEQISHLSTADLTVAALVGAGLVKLLASAMIVTAGWRGGFIIPLFFVGAAFGMALADAFELDRGITMTALMVAVNVGVTKTPLGSTLIVAGMAGFTALPTMLIAALVSLLLTSRVGFIDTQRTRDGAT
jgi:H+/Cl- antiporter ClcA